MRRAVCILALVLLPAALRADDAKPLSVEEAAVKVGEKVILEFEVKSTGQANNKLIFLNSERNHRLDKNFTIVIDRQAEEKFAKAAQIKVIDKK